MRERAWEYAFGLWEFVRIPLPDSLHILRIHLHNVEATQLGVDILSFFIAIALKDISARQNTQFVWLLYCRHMVVMIWFQAVQASYHPHCCQVVVLLQLDALCVTILR